MKQLGAQPLIRYSLDIARALSSDDHICVSTDDKQVIDILKAAHYQVPFTRPDHLATDEAGMHEVMLHALSFYKNQGIDYNRLVLLQPTSPFRTEEQVHEAISLFHSGLDMVVSVKVARSNPYYVLMEENKEGWLSKSKQASFGRRQDAPEVYELNGAIYVINANRLLQGPISGFERIKKYVMNEISSLDLDTPFDWMIAETVMEKGLFKKG